ncbi:MAG: manganese catalase family protein [Clostridia bacterium]|nr:manganese catalase family protein [Clostridia bacterium]
MRYLHQRYSCPNDKITGILTDVGTEELAHMEMVAAIIYQLTRNLSQEEIAGTPFAAYFVDHTTGIYPVAASGVPYDMKYISSKGDLLTDLHEDLAADAAITQTQPLSKNHRKPLKYKDFSHFGKTLKNCHPAIT